MTRGLNLTGANSAVVTFDVADFGISAAAGDDELLEFWFAANGVDFVKMATF